MLNDATAAFDPWTRRYLAFLGVQAPAPGLAGLKAIVRAHNLAVTFENLTAQRRRREHPIGDVPPPDLDALLTAWERGAGGGVCFEIVPMVTRLLLRVGYDAYPVLGQISLPNGHQAVVVVLDGRRHLVDLGNGAPLLEPIPLDQLPCEIHRHGLSFRFRPGAHADELLQERAIDGAWTTYCRYDLRPAADADREQGYQHHHTPNASWVTATLTMVRCTEDAVYSLKDDVLTRHTSDGKSSEIVAGAAGYRRLANEVYGLPGLDIEEALAKRREIAI
jgi:N-hydroxyarylamine O-acetyltransferase